MWDTLVLTSSSTYFLEFYIHLIILKNDCKPLTARVEEARWRMFGHILRSAENTPAQTALSFALELPYRPNFGRPNMCTALFPNGPNYGR